MTEKQGGSDVRQYYGAERIGNSREYLTPPEMVLFRAPVRRVSHSGQAPKASPAFASALDTSRRQRFPHPALKDKMGNRSKRVQ